MKTIYAMFASALFTAGVSATEVYHGLESGNAELSTDRLSAEYFVGVQPSIGDVTDRYHGWAEGNSDLFETDYSAELLTSR